MGINKEGLPILKEQDVIIFRNRIQSYAVKINMSVLNQTKLITAASELGRNMLKYAGGGNVYIEIVKKGLKTGICLTFVDKGPGIANISLAMKDGYTTAGSLGLGLPGAKRLSDEFEIESVAGSGTKIVITKWG